MKILYFLVLSGLLALAACSQKTTETSDTTTSEPTVVTDTKPDKPQPIECFDANDPVEVEWMEAAFRLHDPYRITKFVYLIDGWAYYYESETQNFLYDCQGTLLCTVEGKAYNDCARKVDNLGQGKLLFEKE